MKNAQTKLFSGPFCLAGEKSSFGGKIRAGKRKTKRPFIPRQPMHIVMRSSKARGEMNFLREAHKNKIAKILRMQAKRHFVKFYHFVNVGNHLHIKVKAYSHDSFKAFLISSTSLIARAVTGAKKGNKFGKFWDGLAFTRVLRSSYEEKGLWDYFTLNAFEAKFGKEIRDIFTGKKMLVPV